VGHATRLLLSVSAFFVIGAAPLLAQQTSSPTTTAVPRLIRVTGFFRPADGRPVAPVEQITFAVYAEEAGGTSLWQETQSVAVEANGQYSVLLGATRTEGVPPEIFASGDAHWLAVRVERPGERDQPRVRLTSVPYALRASDADTLGGKPASAYVLASPPASTPTATGSSDVILSGTPNFLAKYVSSTDIANSTVYEVGGSVGINTSTPLDTLHVRFNNTSGAFTGIAVQNLGNTTTSYSGMLFYDHTGQLGQFQGFNNVTHEYRINNIAFGGTINFMTNSISRFMINNDGRVGIGTPTPSSALDVVGDVNLSANGVLRQNNATWAHKRGITGNVALGFEALALGAASFDNVAIGDDALAAMGAGGNANVAVGRSTLTFNAGGSNNTAIGFGALHNGQGTANTALGFAAGYGKATGDFNLYLGYNVANDSNNTESNTIRVGDSGVYSRLFVGGVRGVTTGAADAVSVLIDSNGQLGTVNSSRRYKEDIHDMGDASSGLMKLRPVTYRYAQPYADGSKPIDYGLIAEEVEAVYPDLVAHLADGQVETVQYHKINAMLLNEVQKQHRQLESQRTEIELLKARLAALEAQRR
jgi:Chaperone of endosialidase